MHKLLERQLKRIFPDQQEFSEAYHTFFKVISETYEHFDQDHDLIERSLELSSKELSGINERLRTEINTVTLRTRELEEARAKDSATLSSIGEGLMATDQRGNIILMNGQAEEMINWMKHEAMGKSFLEVMTLVDEKNTNVVPERQPIHLAVTSGLRTNSSSYYYIRRDGSKFAISITASPVRIGDTSIGAVQVFRDITKERDIDRTKSEFVSLASHQLRTPLSTVNWYAEMLLDGDAGTINDEQREYIEAIYKGNQRMVGLVNALLDVSRIELGTFAIEPEPVNIAEVADSLLEELAPKIVGKKMAIVKKYDPAVPALSLDPRLIRIIIQNFLTNSVKYSPPEATITVAVERKDPNVLISVADTGIGIPQSQQANIFTKLFRADNVVAMDTEGTGLGLYIVKSIIESAGGTLRFESVENKGTTFYVTIPLEGMKSRLGSKKLGS